MLGMLHITLFFPARDQASPTSFLPQLLSEEIIYSFLNHEFSASNVRICMALNTQNEQNPVREILPHIHSLGEVLKWPNLVISDGIPVLQIYTREWFAANMKLIDKKKRTFVKKSSFAV